MKQLFKNTAAVVLGLGLAVSAIAADEFQLKANIQTQGKASYENDAFDSFWFRANFGGKYASEDMDAQVMIRMYGPKFGNTIEEKSYDKFLADLYWADYKWDLGANKVNLKLGHWKTDWSQSGNFGTYIDPNLKTRGFLMRDYSHDAFELGWKYGPSALHAMIATSDSKFKTGYVRVEERLQLAKPLKSEPPTVSTPLMPCTSLQYKHTALRAQPHSPLLKIFVFMVKSPTLPQAKTTWSPMKRSMLV